MKTLLAIVVVILIMILANAAYGQSQPTERINAIVKSESAKAHLDPALVMAVIAVESNFNPNAVGTHGEIGLMQLHPRFHVVHKGDVAGNIRVGVRYLNHLRAVCSGRYGDAWFVCFNHGPNAKIKSAKDTSYYRRVIAAKVSYVVQND